MKVLRSNIVEKTIRNHPLIFVSGEITASLRSALSWDPYICFLVGFLTHVLRHKQLKLYLTFFTTGQCNFVIYFDKDFDSLCLGKNTQCRIMSNVIPDPRKYNLTEDFIFIDQEWGSSFYKYIGKMNKIEAKQICSKYGDLVHLPIPRFSDENDFFRNYFGNESIWLDISYHKVLFDKGQFKTNGFTSASGHLFTDRIRTVPGVIEINKYKWMDTNTSNHERFHEVILTNDGQWILSDEQKLYDSVCVYNIIPDETCSKCPDKDFCRFTDKSRQKTECACSAMKKGKVCGINRCKIHCQNTRFCEVNDTEVQCICQFPFQGHNCDLSKILFLCFIVIPKKKDFLNIFAKFNFFSHRLCRTRVKTYDNHIENHMKI